jgi:predicted DNA-binding WGR domain protein
VLVIHYGRRGGLGNFLKKEFDDKTAARAELESSQRKKEAGGYHKCAFAEEGACVRAA